MMKRYEIQVLLRAGHTQAEVARLTGVPERTVRRVQEEPAVVAVDEGAERERRGIGRPSKAEPFRTFVTELLVGEPELRSVEVLRRAKLTGYAGGKTALYDLIAAVRPRSIRPIVRFEGLPGEFTQHRLDSFASSSAASARCENGAASSAWPLLAPGRSRSPGFAWRTQMRS